MKIYFHTLQSQKVEWASTAIEEFCKKINHYIPLEFKVHKSKNFSRTESELKIKKEEELVLKTIKPKDFLILFDDGGKEFSSSVELSKALFKNFEHHNSNLHFLIGGAYGVSEAIKNRAQQKWKLASLTMNHHVAQLMALEQIYRAIMIKENRPYHNI